MQVISHFDPESVNLMGIVCDDAWREVQAAIFFPSPHDRDQFLGELASRVLRAVADGERDPVRLRAIALDGFQPHY